MLLTLFNTREITTSFKTSKPFLYHGFPFASSRELGLDKLDRILVYSYSISEKDKKHYI